MRLTYCGDDCERCPRHIATVSGDPARLRAAAELWKRCGINAAARPEDMICKGCASHPCVYGIAECARVKRVENCGRCDEYPCRRIRTAFDRTAKLAELCGPVCTPEESAQMREAFLRKKERLDAVNAEFRNSRGGAGRPEENS